jgi:hypothetical protein
VNKEEEFTKYMVIPTLHQVGFTCIRYVHGMDEHGRDVVFFDRDRLGQESFHAAQVKFGDLRGTQKAKIQRQIIPQLLEGLRAPYSDPETGRTHRVSRMYLIISGDMVGTARNQIYSLLESEPNIVAVDRQTLDLLSNRDGIITMFGFTGKRNTPGWSSGSVHALPRLPLLTKGTALEIAVQIEEFDYFSEAFEIVHVTYHPNLRHQEVTLFVPGLTEELRECLSEAVYNSLHHFNALWWQDVEETLALKAAMRKASKLLQPRFEGGDAPA